MSLHTKDPIEAKGKAIQLLSQLNNMAKSDMSKIGKFEMTMAGGAVTFKLDKDDPNDVEKLGRFLKENPAFSPQAQTPVVAQNPVIHGAAFNIVVEKYEKRMKDSLVRKTLYGYLQNIRIFQAWAEKQLGKNPFPITMVDRNLIALYIDHLRSLGINPNTIAKNYLIALNGVFKFATSVGDYPNVEAPTRLHNLVNKKTKIEKPRNPFTLEDLRNIFNPANLPHNKHPEQFFAPLIGLFTGARITEICQLHVIDISKKDGFYTISINDEDLKTIKSDASRRIIPIHPVLIEIGFIEYIEDMKKFGGFLFPTVKPCLFGYAGKEPGRRFATYLDKIGITDSSKVFHSFRSTANIVLMDAKIEEEKRCAFIGHEHHTTNSKNYGHKRDSTRGKFTPEFLNELIVPVLKFDVDFSKLRYKSGMFDRFIYNEIRKDKNKAERAKKLETSGQGKKHKLKNTV